MTTSDTLIKYYEKDEETGEMIPVRYMTPAEVEERDSLNIANTASALRARVVAELAKENGHGGQSTAT